MTSPRLLVSRRIRTTPYTPRIESLGVSDYSVVNHTILPKGFRRSVVDDYWHLREHVQLWDVGCQRQVELRGPDAAHLTQLMTPRDLRRTQTGQCLYVPMVDEKGCMLNDPIILKLAEDHFWLSISDSDLLLWAKGLATGMKLNVAVDEPDIWPISVQGPKSDDLMALVFGDTVRDIRFFRFEKLHFHNHSHIVSRTGYSKQGGFEIYPEQPASGLELWDALWQAGINLDIAPGSPNLIERVEGGLLSYGNDMTRENNPLECGFGRYCQLDGSIDFIGLNALRKIASDGVRQIIRGVLFDGDACPPCQHPWPVMAGTKQAGMVTTAIWSPRFKNNVALAMMDKNHCSPATAVSVQIPGHGIRRGQVVSLPFPDTDMLPWN